MNRRDTKSSQEIFIKGSMILAITTAIVKLSGFPLAFLMHRILGLDGNAVYLMSYEIFALGLTIATAGLPVAVAKLVAESVAKEKYEEARQIRRLSTIIFTILGLIISLVVFFGAGPISEKRLATPETYYPLMISAPAIFILGLTSSYRGYYNGLHNMIPTGVSQAVEAISKLSFSLGLASFVRKRAFTEFFSSGTVFGKVVSLPAGATDAETTELLLSKISPYTASAAMLGVTLSVICGFIFLIIYSKVKHDPLPLIGGDRRLRPNKIMLKIIIIVAIPIALSSIASTISSTIDSVTITNRISIAATQAPDLMRDTYSYIYEGQFDMDTLGLKIYGIYTGKTMTLFTLVTTFTAAFSTASLPVVAEAWAQNDRLKLSVQINDSFRLTSLLAMPTTFVFITMGEPFLRLIFRSEADISLAAELLAFLSIGLVLVALATPVNAILQGIGLAKIALFSTVLGSLVKFLSNYFLLSIPGISLSVIPLGTILCYGIITVFGMIVILRKTNAKIDVSLVFIKPLFSGLVCGIITYFTYSTLSGQNRLIPLNLPLSSIVSIAISCIFGVVSYVISLFLMKGITLGDFALLPFGKKLLKRLDKKA